MIEKILAVLALLSLVFVIGFIVYDTTSQNEQTLIVDLEDGADPFIELKHIMPENTTITSVREGDKSQNTYIVKVKTRHKKQKLLNWLLRMKNVEGAESKH